MFRAVLYVNGSNESSLGQQPRPNLLSGTSSSTKITASVMSREGLNASAAHGSNSNKTRSSTRAMTSCSSCEIGASAMQLVYWKPVATTAGLSNASITAAPYTIVSDNYTLSVYPLT